MALVKDRRRLGAALRTLGFLLASGGGLCIIGGSIAPWAQVTLFGLPLAAPGVVFTGAWSLIAGTLALATMRRSPLFAVGCGLIALAVGMVGGKSVPRNLTHQILSLRQRLIPVNVRLEQVNLAPIEPFGIVSRTRDISGPGPAWVIGGGVLVALGGVGLLLGDRWWRSCPQCQALWPEARLPELLHCPGCGLKRTDSRQCARCYHIALSTDRHCVHCGETLE